MYGNTATTLCGPLAINYRGYIYAAIAGTYTFKMAGPDDRVFLWLGNNAITGWTSANALINLWYASGAGSATYTVTTAGTYLPIRVVAANNAQQSGTNSGGGTTWSLTMTNPYGIDYDIGSSTSPNSANLLRFSCDTVAAPMYSYSIGSEL